MARIYLQLLAVWLAAAGFQLTAAAQTATETARRYEKGGLAIDMSFQPTDGGEAVVTLRITDSRSGEPLSNLHPKAWIVPRKSGTPQTEESCRETIRSRLSGRLRVEAGADLNGFRLLTLNHDRSITIINPLIRFGRTQLEGIIPLPGVGADWALAPNRRLLFVTLPEQSAVAVVDLVTRKLLTTVSTGERGKPRRLKMTPDGRHVLVAVDETARAVMIDTETRRTAAVIPIGEGLHNLALSGDGRYAGITNTTSDTVSLIDLKSMKSVGELPVGRTPVAIAYGPAAKLFYAAGLNGESISAIDPETRRMAATIPAKRGLAGLGFSPDGRFAVLVNQVESTISVLDSATNTITAEAPTGREPDQVAFTARYAYVRSLASEKFTLFDLAEIRRGELSAVEIQAGRQAPNAEPVYQGVASMIAPTPEGNAAMIANPADRTIYYYTEGLMAPMGTFDNYKRAPLALMVLDHSLAETLAGVYSTSVKLSGGGEFDVPVLIDQPRVAHCFPLTLAAPPTAAPAQALAVEFLFGDAGPRAGDPVKLRFKILDAATRSPIRGLRDVRTMVIEPPDGWQQRQWAAEVDPGVYEITQSFPRPGRYQVLISVPSRAIGFARLPTATVQVGRASLSSR
ncbi:MAG TPA: YncE family protein [Blastocatellia bacterium]|nr:YncE family protein [Blastocatellia bacterium]